MVNGEEYKTKAIYNNKEDIIWDLVVKAVVVVMAAVKLDKLAKVDFHYSLYFCRIDYSWS